jgi:hypothetical protein
MPLCGLLLAFEAAFICARPSPLHHLVRLVSFLLLYLVNIWLTLYLLNYAVRFSGPRAWLTGLLSGDSAQPRCICQRTSPPKYRDGLVPRRLFPSALHPFPLPLRPRLAPLSPF